MPPSPSAPLLSRLGRACHDRPRRVVGLWVLLVVGLGAVMGSVGSAYSTEFTLPDVESERGFRILDEAFDGNGAGMAGFLVFVADEGVTDPAVQGPMEEFFARMEAEPDVRVTSPYAPGGERQISSRGDLAGRLAYAEIELPREASIEDAADVRERMKELLPDVEGLRVEIGGQIFAEFEPPDAELIGLAFAVVILIVAFGSVIAMGLPIGTALAGIGVGFAGLTLLSHVQEMPDFTSTIAVMIGLGVGIDYALFIVTRYREELHRGRPESDAAATAINTAGRAVLFAGVTVVISLLGMMVMGLQFVQGLALGAALVVFVTMIASVTLLPALLGLVGDRLEVTRWRGIVTAGLVALGLLGVGLKVGALVVAFPAALVVLVAGMFVPTLKRTLPQRPPKPLDRTIAFRWSRVVQRRPWTALLGGLALLLVLALPVLSLRLGFSDEGNYPEDTTTRQAYDLLAEGFGPGFNGPFMLVAELDDTGTGTGTGVIGAVDRVLAEEDGIAFASPALPNDPEAPSAVAWSVIPTTSPQDEATEELVHRLRDETLPGATAGTGVDVLVTGAVAVNLDFSEYLGERLVWFLAAVLALSFLLLMAVFRSLLVPLKAVVMNLVSIGAAYGMVVALFQWGWLRALIGVEPGPIEPFIPMMLFAIVFGLSMDYEVFLLSRVKEEYDAGSTNDKAVADGLACTARVITAAAAIMVVVFGSFLLEDDRVVKLMGFGLGVAVLLDATVVRMVLVPATMELLGDRNWWLPRFLDRVLPKIDVEGERHAVHVPDPTPAGAGEAEEDRELAGHH